MVIAFPLSDSLLKISCSIEKSIMSSTRSTSKETLKFSRFMAKTKFGATLRRNMQYPQFGDLARISWLLWKYDNTGNLSNFLFLAQANDYRIRILVGSLKRVFHVKFRISIPLSLLPSHHNQETGGAAGAGGFSPPTFGPFPEDLRFSLGTYLFQTTKILQKHNICKNSNAFYAI